MSEVLLRGGWIPDEASALRWINICYAKSGPHLLLQQAVQCRRCRGLHKLGPSRSAAEKIWRPRPQDLRHTRKLLNLNKCGIEEIQVTNVHVENCILLDRFLEDNYGR